MQEFFDAVKVTGPTVAVLLAGVVYLWRRNSQLQQKAFELYDRLLAEQKQATVHLLQLLSESSSGAGKEDLATRYVALLTQRADDLKQQLDTIRQKPAS